jgi:hypothetical protein
MHTFLPLRKPRCTRPAPQYALSSNESSVDSSEDRRRWSLRNGYCNTFLANVPMNHNRLMKCTSSCKISYSSHHNIWCNLQSNTCPHHTRDLALTVSIRRFQHRFSTPFSLSSCCVRHSLLPWSPFVVSGIRKLQYFDSLSRNFVQWSKLNHLRWSTSGEFSSTVQDIFKRHSFVYVSRRMKFMTEVGKQAENHSPLSFPVFLRPHVMSIPVLPSDVCRFVDRRLF